ncbi:hypothetical protein TrCOL_g1789 [Triparma columacea]|nr:hypothetical protein TrCOL_g1789 [Triparma columacea]
MCSEPESDDRLYCMEISAFESTSSTFHLPPKSRVPDPARCVKKYRRSAAGGGVKSYRNEKPRGIAQLHDTVTFLFGQVYNERERFNNTNLSSAVSFISDRLRAIQVDIVTNRLLENKDERLPAMLGRMCSFYILNIHLLSQLKPPHFEHRFNMQALQSSLQMLKAYYELNPPPSDAPYSLNDEHLAYSALLHISSHINGGQGGGVDFGQGLNPMCTICPKDYSPARYPKLSFVLKMASSLSTCDFTSILKMISPKVQDTRFHYLVRCCLAPSIPTVRLELLKRMNKAWGKGEKVKVEEVARLLRMTPRFQDCSDFCASHGLPCGDGSVAFKVNPVEENPNGGGRPLETNGTRAEDTLVFGEGGGRNSEYKATRGEYDKQGVNGLNETFARWILDVQ